MNLDLKTIKLTQGVGSPQTGGCWLSALSVYAGESWGDHPDCVCDLTAPLLITINDALPDDETRGEVIGPRLFDPLGTRSDDPGVRRQRLWILVDAAVREFAPFALDAAGLSGEADKLRALRRLTPENADAAHAAAYAARAARHDARDDAHDARAARHDARDDAHDAAHDAARAAAYAAADTRTFVEEFALPVVDRLFAVGDTRPVERDCTDAQLAASLGGATTISPPNDSPARSGSTPERAGTTASSPGHADAPGRADH